MIRNIEIRLIRVRMQSRCVIFAENNAHHLRNRPVTETREWTFGGNFYPRLAATRPTP